MSAIPAIRPQYRTSTRSTNLPVARQIDRPRARPRVVERTRTSFGVVILAQAAAFTILAGITYFASALGGQVMVEKARHDVLNATARTRASQSALGPLKAEAERVKDGLEIQKWALANQFRAPEWAPAASSEGKNLVASQETN